MKELLIVAAVALLVACLPHAFLMRHSDLMILAVAIFAILLRAYFAKREWKRRKEMKRESEAE